MLNIEELTVAQIKQIAAFANSLGACGANAKTSLHPFVGRYVICRCYSAGVHAGELVSQNGDEVILKNSRRLWSWRANSGVALSGVAVSGLSKKDTKVDVVPPEISLTGVIETIPCSDTARESINGF